MQLTQLIDSQGNPISITTSDGQTIPVVTDGDENCIKGLLPDGTLIPIDLDKDLTKVRIEIFSVVCLKLNLCYSMSLITA